MLRGLCLLTCTLCLVLTGCEQQKAPEPAPTPPVTQAVAPTADAPTATEPATATAPQAETSPQASAQESTAAPPQDTAGTAAAVMEKVQETATTAAEKVVTATEQATATAAGATAAATTMVKETVAKATDPAAPEQLVLEASYGNVTFPHGMHADAFECSKCHGTAKPAAFGLTKDVAHVLCKDCHKKEGGPTSCKDCHKK